MISKTKNSNPHLYGTSEGVLGDYRILPSLDLRVCRYAKPLYEATKEKPGFVWNSNQQQAFDILKRKLLETPALGLTDINKPFYLFVEEHMGQQRVC